MRILTNSLKSIHFYKYSLEKLGYTFKLEQWLQSSKYVANVIGVNAGINRPLYVSLKCKYFKLRFQFTIQYNLCSAQTNKRLSSPKISAHLFATNTSNHQ